MSGADSEIRRWLVAAKAQLGEREVLRVLQGLQPSERCLIEGRFPIWGHGAQRAIDAAARTLVLQAGRGFGKTRAGAEWVWARSREAAAAQAGTAGDHSPLQIALVGATIDDVVKVMVEGPSGLAATARSDESVRWVASRRRADLSCGAQAFAYSAERPDGLRGPQHHFAWCDELAKWTHGDSTWDNLMLGLRLGAAPRTIVTTTPRPVPLLRRILALSGTQVLRGRTFDNPHLGAEFLDSAKRAYGGTRLGRQELEGELIDEPEAALWLAATIAACRAAGAPERGTLRRVVVGVDPPAGGESERPGSACGIVVCAVGHDRLGWVLEDASASALSPEGWARRVADAAERWGAHRVVAEANNGGKMVETVLRGANVNLPVKLVRASEGKAARAEPVAALFEGRRVKLSGRFPELEDELRGMSLSGVYSGPGGSPDRADAMVYALTELMLGAAGLEPRVRSL